MGFWNFVFRGTPPGASSPPPPPVIAPPLSPKPPVAAACQVQIPASWEKTPPAHLKFLTQFLNGCVFVASGKWYWDQALGEPSATSVRRFIAAGLIVPASIASKLERHFNTKELQAFLRARNLPISGKKAALVERLLAADPAWMEAKVAGVTVYNCTPAGKHLAEQYIAAEEEKIRIAHERSL